MRKLGAALLAMPVLLLVYLAAVGRSAGRGRAVGFVGVAGLVALVLIAGSRPAPGVAAPPSTPRAVEAQLLDSVVTGHGLKTPFSIGFDAPMDAASVVGALRVDPDAAVAFSWDAAGKTLTVAPVGAWSPDTLYTITVGTTARSAAGTALGSPVRAVVLTAKAGAASLVATKLVSGRAAVDTAFAIHLDRAVAVTALQAAVKTIPAVGGTVTAGAAAGDYVFTPDAPLSPNTSYAISIDGLADGDGVPFAMLPSMTVKTVTAPAVVRFRPADGTTGVDRSAVLSVRFTQPMNRASAAGALAVTAAGKKVAGKIAWAEGNRVLVFTPAAALPYGAKVVMTVGASAAAASGLTLEVAASGAFTVKPQPVVKPAVAKTPAKPAPAKAKTTTTTKATTKPIPHPSGGSGAVAGTWYSVEVYYLNLMNCTRTGGWVTSSGACSSPGGRNVAPLKLSAGISSKVSRPYAQYLATHNLCNHFYNGTPGDRLRRAGFTSYNWGENIGCENFSPYKAVLGDHLFFQSEKSYNGGHYRNLMNALYTEAGVGVWVSSGRVRLVIDFYRP